MTLLPTNSAKGGDRYAASVSPTSGRGDGCGAVSPIPLARERLERAFVVLAGPYGSPTSQAQEAVAALDAYLEAREALAAVRRVEALGTGYRPTSGGGSEQPPQGGSGGSFVTELLTDPRPESGR